MARLPRYYLPHHPQHIIVRGNNGCDIFKSADDYNYYLQQLKKACEKHDCELHAYTLMANHVHLLITPHKEQSIGKAMQMIGRYYVQYFNQSYERSGTLWEGRYKATVIDAENYLLDCSRYIELNAVRAGIVDDPADYPWSSYGSNALGQNSECLSPSTEYKNLGNTSEEQVSAYRSLFANNLSTNKIEEFREATNKAWVLGSKEFKEQIAGLVNRRTEPKARGGDRRSKTFKAKLANVDTTSSDPVDHTDLAAADTQQNIEHENDYLEKDVDSFTPAVFPRTPSERSSQQRHL